MAHCTTRCVVPLWFALFVMLSRLSSCGSLAMWTMPVVRVWALSYWGFFNVDSHGAETEKSVVAIVKVLKQQQQPFGDAKSSGWDQWGSLHTQPFACVSFFLNTCYWLVPFQVLCFGEWKLRCLTISIQVINSTRVLRLQDLCLYIHVSINGLIKDSDYVHEDVIYFSWFIKV